MRPRIIVTLIERDSIRLIIVLLQLLMLFSARIFANDWFILLTRHYTKSIAKKNAKVELCCSSSFRYEKKLTIY